LELSPDSAETKVALGLLLLATGRPQEGWPLVDARHDTRAGVAKPQVDWPEWRGEPLAGKVLHVFPDEGMGDQIQMVRAVPALEAQGADVRVICTPPLARLFAQSLTAPVYPASGAVSMPDPDYWVMFGSLFGRAGLTAETAPKPPYLRTPKVRPIAGARIGVMTRGNPAHSNDGHRSLPSELGQRLLELPGAIALQPEATGAKDFADTAAIIGGLDLVISVDTSVAHLAGAMGKPVWILLPFLDLDWRWLTARDDSPWYPSARLFRQGPDNDWTPVVEAVVAAFTDLPATAADGR
jgi:hypothetical protein